MQFTINFREAENYIAGILLKNIKLTGPENKDLHLSYFRVSSTAEIMRRDIPGNISASMDEIFSSLSPSIES